MSAAIMTTADARRKGLEFVQLMSHMPAEGVVGEQNQRAMQRLIKSTLETMEDQQTYDLLACEIAQKFCQAILDLHYFDLLLPDRDEVRSVLIDCLEIASEATDLRAEVLQ